MKYLILIFILCLFDTVTVAAEKKLRNCGLENCHGLDLKCSFNTPKMCTEMYAIGDFCREYAKCEISNNACVLVKNSKLDKCINCMSKCQKQDPIVHSECESRCREVLAK